MPTQIPAQGIAAGAVTADKLAANAISQDKFAAGIQTGGSGPTISTVTITDNVYSANGQTHMPTEGGYFKIVGTNFSAGVIVAVGSTTATATTFVSGTELHVQAPAKAEGTYQVQVTNSNGGWAFKANAITYSGTPTWVTDTNLANGASGLAYSQQLSATGATSYTLAPGSSLPTGLTLSAGGLLSGTVTVGANTNYTFTIRAVDAENQYSSRTFNLNIVLAFEAVTISPAINSKTTWTFKDDGNALTIPAGTSYTITNNTPIPLNLTVKLWGGGAGGQGGFTTGTYTLAANGASIKCWAGSAPALGIVGGSGGYFSGAGASAIYSATDDNTPYAVAGGGGGQGDRTTAGNGGGSSGTDATNNPSWSAAGGKGGTQTAGGAGGAGNSGSGQSGGFRYGGAGGSLTGASFAGGAGWGTGGAGGYRQMDGFQGGGGGGYYGGGGGGAHAEGASGGGGSGYIGGIVGGSTTTGVGSDSDRGTAGNPAVNGKIMLILQSS